MEEGQVNPRNPSQVGSEIGTNIPAGAARSEGREFGDLVVAHPTGPSRIVPERQFDVIAEFAGALTGVYQVGEYEKLRAEWD
jgi:hypothetical protein